MCVRYNAINIDENKTGKDSFVMEHVDRASRDTQKSHFDNFAVITYYNSPWESESKEQYWDEFSLSEAHNSPYRIPRTKARVVTTATTTKSTNKHKNIVSLPGKIK